MKIITIIGTGYVGLVSGAGISDFGHNVVCADIDEDKIKQLINGQIPIYEPGLYDLVDRNVKHGRLSFSNDIAGSIENSDIIFIAVGTPEGANGTSDLTAVYEVARAIGNSLNGYKVVCTKSTVPIGTGAEILKIIKDTNKSKNDFDYVSNPEFLREGSAVKDFLWPDRVIIGASNEKAFDFMKDVYRPLYINETPIIETSIETAELIKYASNAFLSVKISYINEIANICDAIGADVHVVSKAMGIDGRISPKFLHPGPGFGGSCFPKDTKALIAMAEALGTDVKVVESAIEANQSQKVRMVNKLINLFNDDVHGKTIAILGLSFKAQTDDVRESPAINMIAALKDRGAIIKAYDPVANENMKKIFNDLDIYNSWEDAVCDADGVVIMTEWNEFRGLDLPRLKDLVKSPNILDCRNILNIDDLESLGFHYDNVGRKKA
ncbi:MAG TPA: UDP-glucose/GDP-mannose dehydrogenase family protein [Candidatus Marinimicrobia bacterium]|jgi:UDPglucose 6-dehydrogenase|nr:UDP-glucose/GDP-mannose dehydrogenase family protein [Candidatus Neomarinimicrobiota bacterium]|tara:strand:- start:378 stop:1691 length:1314 start_codon:yes stop_codon:yes gene_type:complete